MCNHSQGILIVLSFGGLTSLHYVGIDILCRIIFKEIRQIYHQALCTPVCYQTLRSFHNQVRCRISFDGGIYLVVTALVVQILYGNMDIRILSVKILQ